MSEKYTIFEAAHTYEQSVGFGKFYPFAAAAKFAANELICKGAYRSEYPDSIPHNAVRFEDDVYLVKDEIRDIPNSFGLPLGAPTDIIRVKIEPNNYPKEAKNDYVKTCSEMAAILEKRRRITDAAIISVIRTEKSVYLLARKEPVQLEKFTISREMAVSHAKSKLTDEEKSLLGVT